MIGVNAIWLLSIIGIGAIALILTILLLINSSLRGKDFSLLRNFPFEFGKVNPNTFQVFKTLMFILTGFAFSPLFIITPLFKDFGDLGVLCVFITCVFGLLAIANSLLFFFDARYTKTHMILVTIAMSLTLLANALSTLLSIIVYKTYLDMSSSHLSSLILAIVSGILALGMLFLIVNPKLTSWAKLETQTDSNGEKTISRGKVFILALTEWITIAISIIGEIIFLLSIIK